MNGKSVIVLGGGVGGIVAANVLRTLLDPQHTITLVEKHSEHSFAPSFLWLAVGERSETEISTPLAKLLAKGVDIVYDEVIQIDPTTKSVTTRGQLLRYDYLVIALGADYAMDSVKGLAESGISLYTQSGAAAIRDELKKISSGHVAIVVCGMPYKCPAAPHEAAMLIENLIAKRGLKGAIHIDSYTPEPQPMPVAGKQLGEAVMQMLKEKGIGYHPLHKIAEVDPVNKMLHFDNAESRSYNLLIAIPPHKAPKAVVNSGLINETGWIPTDRNTLSTSHEGVYALGDVAAIELPGRWNPDVKMLLPRAGVFAHAQAEVVAQRIADEINNAVPSSMFHGVGYCMLEAGNGVAGFAQGDFYATPSPRLTMRSVGRNWHWGKVLFEKWWLTPVGIKKKMLNALLSIGSRILNIPQ